MKNITFIIRTKKEQAEGLRSSLGLLIENNNVIMVVLDHKVDMTDQYKENLEWFIEMEGKIYSNVKENIEKYGFKPITIKELGKKLTKMDHIIPF
ncbi:Sulfur reduction protein DsrE [Candidatus Magnetomoraceae bacterium gMMP-15]